LNLKTQLDVVKYSLRVQIFPLGGMQGAQAQEADLQGHFSDFV